VAGKPDPVTGFVVDLKWLKDVIEREVLTAYDHRHLNLEVPEFASKIPTTENIAIAIWQRLEPAVTAAGGAKLARVRVYETADIFAEYRGPQDGVPNERSLLFGAEEQVFVSGVKSRGGI
jgi:6-pyruvoyltetrahydropterin/6-carboxytetrahydropterin synthase